MEGKMKIWALLRKKQAIFLDVVSEFSYEEEADWPYVIGELAVKLQQSRPVILSKHLFELRQFQRTTFFPGDFLEPVSFDRMEIEIFKEEKRKR